MNRLIIFSRYPVPGNTKTRLIPALGPVGAAALQKAMTEKVLSTAMGELGGSVCVEVCFEGGTRRQIRKWLGKNKDFSFQSSGDLGVRMQAAFDKAFQNGFQKVVLIGSDIPDMDSGYIIEAFDRLDHYDLVLGPVQDGGYCLMGMKQLQSVFNGVFWGSGQVLTQTLHRAEQLGLDTGLLKPLRDLDTPEDLVKHNLEVQKRPFISVIIPALNEGEHIESAIKSAMDPDVEILVVDGKSEDHTVQKALDLGVRVESASRGRGAQQNRGAETAMGEVLLFLHADTQLPKGYVSQIFEALMEPGVVGGAFQFKTDWECFSMGFIEFFTNLRARFLRLPYGDQGLFIRKSIFEDIGGFQNTPVAEDLMFIRQVTKKGHIRIVSGTAVTSARRWQKHGIVKTTLIHIITMVMYFIRLRP